MEPATKQQFDLSHIQVDEKLQGARLASFSRRVIAYGIDWLIIVACSEFIWLLIPLALVFLIIKRRLKSSMVKGRRYIRKNILHADRKLEAMDIERKLRKRFARSMAFYLYVLMYTPIVISVLLVLVFVLNLIYPWAYDAMAPQWVSWLGNVFRPVSDLSNGFHLLISFFGAFIYFAVFTWKWKGQTPGKKLMQIRVVKLNGHPITFWGSLERASGYTASAAILFYGFFQYFWDRNRQTTHDKITETIVVDC